MSSRAPSFRRTSASRAAARSPHRLLSWGTAAVSLCRESGRINPQVYPPSFLRFGRISGGRSWTARGPRCGNRGNGSAKAVCRHERLTAQPTKIRVAMTPRAPSTRVKNAPSPDHAACFSRGDARRRVHQAAVGWRDHEDCVGPIYKQDDGSEQPTPLEGAEKGDHPEEPADDGEARLHHVAAPIGQLPLDE